MPGICLECAWNVPGIDLELTWNVPGIWQEWTWNVSEINLLFFTWIPPGMTWNDLEWMII